MESDDFRFDCRQVVVVLLVVVAAVFLPKHVSVICYWADRDSMPNRIKHSVLTDV